MLDKSDEIFEGDENFVHESLHLQAVLPDKSDEYFVRHCFV